MTALSACRDLAALDWSQAELLYTATGGISAMVGLNASSKRLILRCCTALWGWVCTQG